MKKTWLKFTVFTLAAVLVAPVSLLAQKDEKEKDKDDKGKKEIQQLIITTKTDKDEKIIVEIKGDKVTINGKSLEEFKDKNGDISVKLNKLKNMEFLARVPNMTGSWNFNDNKNGEYNFFSEDADRPMLGVTTEKTELGAKVNSITKESAAEKIGLKEGDVITKVGDIKIEDADDLSAAIKKNKPGDKVIITYLRDKKEQKATAELTKWKGQSFKVDMGDMNFDKMYPKIEALPRIQNRIWSGSTPKLGLSVQDTDDGKGVKVIEVDEESNAEKAGIKEDDLISEIDGKAVNSTDEVVKIVRESKDKNSVMIKLQRAGKTQNIEVKMPRKIKTADL